MGTNRFNKWTTSLSNLPGRFFRKKKEMLLICILLLIIFFLLIRRMMDLNNLLDVHKCPACYGVSYCPQLTIARIPFTFSSFISYYLNTKNVYYAYIKNKPVILKKLAHNSELDKFDKNLCTTLGLSYPCDYDNLLDRQDLSEKIISLVDLKNDNLNILNMVLCPTTDGLDTILNPYIDSIFIKSVANANLFTIMNINPEIIVMLYLNGNNQFPVAKYLGSCGRIAVISYEGLSLSHYTSVSWIKRAKISQKLLSAVDKFTFLDERFSFYWTDMSLDNIVIGDNADEISPIFVDLENVIIVDKYATNQPTNWKVNHTSDDIKCTNCFMFSPKNICSHQYSDHNHYSLCKILQEEFLYPVPSYVSQTFPDLIKLLESCVIPVPGTNRFKSAKMLNNELLKITSYFSV